MGEIRSTLDIIMEKTRDLSLSPEEKRKLRGQEWLGKARGWVQKYQDELIGVKEVQAALQKLGESEGADRLLKQEIIGAIEPGGDNGKRWDLLERLWPTDLERHKEIVRHFQEELEQARSEKIRLALDRLAERNISGAAVVPNLNRDPDWTDFRRLRVEECRRELSFKAV
jgi:hypothetical protein